MIQPSTLQIEEQIEDENGIGVSMLAPRGYEGRHEVKWQDKRDERDKGDGGGNASHNLLPCTGGP
jgi:hypothetical protein